jgi:uncharacterized protein DUF2188
VIFVRPTDRPGPKVLVIRRGNFYSVKTEGSPEALMWPNTLHEAVKIGRALARSYGSELIIHTRNCRGRARRRNRWVPRVPRGVRLGPER